MNTATLALVLVLAATGCSSSAALPQMADGTRCKVSAHAYPWGGYGDKICTDANGNTSTTRMVSSGLYDSGDVVDTQASETFQSVPATQRTSIAPPIVNPNTVVNPNVPTNQPPPFE